VGITITTDDDEIERFFEPQAPPIDARIHALKMLHENGVKTYAFIGPLLPMNPEAFAEKINPYVHAVLIDRMNYVSKTLKMYEHMNLHRWLDDGFIDGIIHRLTKGFAGKDVSTC
jgi:DNA repair photolyase